LSKTETVDSVRAGRQSVPITHPNKILFPNDGITKRELVEYYREIAAVMLPYLRGRAISMQRFPDGIAETGFFQKEASPYYPEWIKTVSLPKHGGSVRYVVCENAVTLVYLANQAVITPHAWLSRTDQPDYPDQLIFDLDPSGDDFRDVCNAAKALRILLDEQGLAAYVKTTGSRGLHVMVALEPRASFDEVRSFARQISQRLAASDPSRLTTQIRKSQRRGRILIDIARNAYAQTAAPAYAVRARDGAPVATPVDWTELDNPKLRPDQFNIRNIFDRIKRRESPWKDWNRKPHRLPKSL
jgi:bifunctional non-homologous end joining protein LigD